MCDEGGRGWESLHHRAFPPRSENNEELVKIYGIHIVSMERSMDGPERNRKSGLINDIVGRVGFGHAVDG